MRAAVNGELVAGEALAMNRTVAYPTSKTGRIYR
jgi:hypothetical protein